jgi:hypothetical protein
MGGSGASGSFTGARAGAGTSSGSGLGCGGGSSGSGVVGSGVEWACCGKLICRLRRQAQRPSFCLAPPPTPLPLPAFTVDTAPMTLADYLALSGPAPAAASPTAAAPSQYAELFLPPAPGPFPVAVLVHGGCWTKEFGGITQLRNMAGALAARGIAVWNVEYRRVDEAGRRLSRHLPGHERRPRPAGRAGPGASARPEPAGGGRPLGRRPAGAMDGGHGPHPAVSPLYLPDPLPVRARRQPGRPGRPAPRSGPDQVQLRPRDRELAGCQARRGRTSSPTPTRAT